MSAMICSAVINFAVRFTAATCGIQYRAQDASLRLAARNSAASRQEALCCRSLQEVN